MPAARPSPLLLASPLSSWFPGEDALARFRRLWLGRRPVVLPARDRAWRPIAPGFARCLHMAATGLPFQIAADDRYDRSADPRRLPGAMAEGKTVFLPQIHQVLPRVMRVMVALRAALLGPFREECSFLFLVSGQGRPGMGLHHDGDVDSFWLQLEGRRTVTIGPPVPPGTPQDIDPHRVANGRRRDWVTLDLDPGTLFYMPPWTPHGVICRRRSLALSLTWARPGREEAAGPRAHAAALTTWDVVSGHVAAMPPISRTRLWAQVPAVAGPTARDAASFPLWLPGGEEIVLPVPLRAVARSLATMPTFKRLAGGAGLEPLLEHGIVGPQDLPIRIVPDQPDRLDGWRFA